MSSYQSRFPEQAGVLAPLIGSLWLMALTAAFTVPVGVGAAVYLEEYAPKNRLTQLIEINISNLAGVPSIVYGLLGLAVFVQWMAMGRSLLAGGLTLSLLVLPIVILTSREAIRSVPQSYRQGAYALGSTQWEVTKKIVLPSAFPGILTGVILAMSRAIGEAAPILAITALVYVTFVPSKPPGQVYHPAPPDIRLGWPTPGRLPVPGRRRHHHPAGHAPVHERIGHFSS